MITNIERKIDTYFITVGSGKTYEISLDEKNLYALSLSKKPLKSSITSKGAIINRFTWHGVSKNPMNKGTKTYIERIVSLPCSIETKIFYLNKICSEYAFEDIADMIDWKDLFQCIQMTEKGDSICKQVNSYSPIESYCKKLLTIKKLYSTFEENEAELFIRFINCHQWLSIEDFISCKTFRQALKSVEKEEKKRQAFIDNIFNAIPEEVLQEKYGIHITSAQTWMNNQYSNILNNYRTIKDITKQAHLNNFKITNLERDAEYLRNYWDKEKTRIENEYFSNKQHEKNLSFENNQYKIYVPYSREELAHIGQYFHNCANNWEWENYLSNGKRHLCVVIDKETNDFKVCLDIDAKSLSIYQYLRERNYDVHDENLLVFKREYQEYLRSLLTEDK